MLHILSEQHLSLSSTNTTAGISSKSKTFLEHLKDCLRAITGTDLPVFFEGPISVGKTSIIRYVTSIAGHKCIRINNHEHSEVEEYLGNYFPDKQGNSSSPKSLWFKLSKGH